MNANEWVYFILCFWFVIGGFSKCNWLAFLLPNQFANLLLVIRWFHQLPNQQKQMFVLICFHSIPFHCIPFINYLIYLVIAWFGMAQTTYNPAMLAFLPAKPSGKKCSNATANSKPITKPIHCFLDLVAFNSNNPANCFAVQWRIGELWVICWFATNPIQQWMWAMFSIQWPMESKAKA